MGEFQDLKPLDGLEVSSISADLYNNGRDDLALFYFREGANYATLTTTNSIVSETISWNENSIAFYYVSKLAKKLGISTVVTANGIDELFCDYNAYREAIGIGVDEVMNVMNQKLDNEKKMMIAVNNVTSLFDVRILQPLLHENFISYAKTIPISEKIIDENDLQRKHAIRKLAASCGVPEISAYKQKKALQYGSKIHKQLLKLR